MPSVHVGEVLRERGNRLRGERAPSARCKGSSSADLEATRTSGRDAGPGAPMRSREVGSLVGVLPNHLESCLEDSEYFESTLTLQEDHKPSPRHPDNSPRRDLEHVARGRRGRCEVSAASATSAPRRARHAHAPPSAPRSATLGHPCVRRPW